MNWEHCLIIISLLVLTSSAQGDEGSGQEGSGGGSGDGAVEIPEVIDSVDYTMSSSDGSFEMR